jgi:hypothetical protein
MGNLGPLSLAFGAKCGKRAPTTEPNNEEITESINYLLVVPDDLTRILHLTANPHGTGGKWLKTANGD